MWRAHRALAPRLLALAILAALVARAVPGPAQTAGPGELVAAARRLSVHRLDRRLRDVPLDRWFRDLAGPHAVVVWEANDCGEACGCPADSGRDLPVCVEAKAQLERGGTATLRIAVGTASHAPSGAPALHYAEVTGRAGGVTSCRTLPEFARAVARSRR